MNIRTAFSLGRISNLPTVLSNCLAGIIISLNVSGDAIEHLNLELLIAVFLTVSFATSLMYLGGMFLNDACDSDWDKQHKPDKPIPSGDASTSEVFIWGGLLLIAGIMIIAASLWLLNLAIVPSTLAAFLLAVVVVAYDALHKKVSFGPWLMGSCRFFVYMTAGLMLTQGSSLLVVAAFTLLSYIVGLTYLAKSEHLNDPGTWWPVVLFCSPVLLAFSMAMDHPSTLIFIAAYIIWLATLARQLLPGSKRNVPRAIGGLLAAIPLIDAMLIAGTGHWQLGLLAAAGFPLTLALHRWVAGT